MVSMGDYAASGGYYISAMADSIFAEKETLTGSIGVFGLIPNLQGLLNNKLGIRMDEVKTGKFADLMTSRSEEHTSELQSRENLVCRLLLEKKNRQPSARC